MIDLVWNFPLLSPQAKEWQGALRRAVERLDTADAREMRPSFRGADLSLRERSARWLGVPVERAWLACSGHHATLLSLLAAGMPGGTMAVEEITYSGILDQSAMLGITLAPCAYDLEGILPEALRAACEQRPVKAVFLMPSVHNPLGIVAGLARRKAVVEVARAFDLVILEDDAYAYMEPDAPPAYAVLAPERTFFIRGFSKVYAPAACTAFLTVPERFSGRIEALLKNTTTGTSTPHNAAALQLIEDGSLDRVVAAKLAEGAIRNQLGREILGSAVAPGARHAWHLWVNLPETLSAAEAQQRCLQRGVMVSGAGSFTAPGIQVPHALRIALGGEVERDRIEQGLRIVADVARA